MITKTRQVDESVLDKIDFDLVLTASGFESRGSFLMMHHSSIKSKNRLVIGFDNFRDDIVRIANDKIFTSLGFKFVVCSGNEASPILRKLEEIFGDQSSKHINVLVDYSCMTRLWYAEILKFFSSKERSEIDLYFSYTVSKYVPPPNDPPLNKFVQPIEGFYSISVPVKPTALLVGLGYVSNRAYGLSEYFDVKPFLFLNDASFNEEFHNEVIQQNQELINDVPPSHIFEYPLNNLCFTETLLNHICLDLLRDYRVVLAPCGPKPFTLLSLVTSLRLENVDVWRISAGEDESPIDRQPLGKVLILKCTIVS